MTTVAQQFQDFLFLFCLRCSISSVPVGQLPVPVLFWGVCDWLPFAAFFLCLVLGFSILFGHLSFGSIVEWM